MGKAGSTKRSKEKKANDFSKAKLKVGKAKQPAANATNTAVKVKRVSLPSQTVGRGSIEQGAEASTSAAPTTKRRLGLDDLVQQLGHYSAHVRKEAIFGLKELLSAHEDIVDPNLGTILRACSRLIADDDSAVRRALVGLFDWLLPRQSAAVLEPFAPLLLFFTTSALSHIFVEVRVDALRVLDILLESCADPVVAGWLAGAAEAHGTRVVECFYAMLHVRGGHATAQTSASARLATLRSLSAFMTAALGSTRDEAAFPSWVFASALSSSQASATVLRDPGSSLPSMPMAHDADVRMQRAKRPRSALVDASSGGWSLAYLGEAGEAAQSTSPLATARTLLAPVLLAAFLDSAPVAFAPSASASADTAHMQTVVAVARIARVLYQGQNVDAADVRSLRALVLKMDAYFPFGADALAKRDVQTEATLQELNLCFCELVATVVDGNAKPDSKVVTMLERVDAHVGRVLGGEAVTAAHPLGQTLTAASYLSLVPTIWSLLSRPGEASATLLEAVLAHYATLSAASALKRPALELVTRVLTIVDQPGYCGRFALQPGSDASVEAFHLGLPRLLWELGTRQPATTLIALRYLHARLAANRPSPAEVAALAASLKPVFVITHPSHGRVEGPYGRWSIEAQAIARAIVVYLASPELSTALAELS